MADSTWTLHKYPAPVGPLLNRCADCKASRPKLLRCVGCLAVRYCNRDHQRHDWPRHKALCAPVKHSRVSLVDKEAQLRREIPDVFEQHAGRFWKVYETRDYMRARLHLADGLLSVGTLDTVREGLEHMRDMIRLCRSDNLGTRDMVPAVMLRLDLDQECYDFVKWWATCDPDGRYDWGDLSLPHLDTRDADVFEHPGFLFKELPELNHIIAILLLKLKLIVDIRNLQVTRKILAQRSVPLDLWPSVELAVIRSPLSATHLQKKSPADLLRVQLKLLQHVRELGAALVSANDNFMFHVFDPEDVISLQPQYFSPGSPEEMVLAMQHSYPVWWETVGVMELLADARACAARDSEDEIPDLMENETSRSAEELLADMSINRIWGYLDWAVENASYLGPPSERPSERHTRKWREASYDDDDDDDVYSGDESY